MYSKCFLLSLLFVLFSCKSAEQDFTPPCKIPLERQAVVLEHAKRIYTEHDVINANRSSLPVLASKAWRAAVFFECQVGGFDKAN